VTRKRFDPNLRPHHHFKCIRRGGGIVDFYNDEYNALKVPAAINERFVILGESVHLEGFCDKCKLKTKK